MSQAYDLVVIGGGPGGYVCAIRAAQLGLRTACVESRGTLGGTCLNVGCIPSKALLHSSHHYDSAKSDLAAHGITAEVSLDLATMLGRKDKVVDDLTKGIEFLFKKNKVDYIRGRGHLEAPGRVRVGETVLDAKAVVIATGSESAPLPGITVDEKRIVSSTGALSLPHVPTSLIVIGAGVIGLELGSVWRRLGAQVTVIEYLDHILPPLDGEVRKTMQRILKKQGLTFKLASKVTSAKASKTGVTLTVEPAQGGAVETLTADVVLVAVGRRPYTEGLGLEALGIVLERGFIKVDAHFATTVPGVYAIGDVIGGAMLAHKAEEEGVAMAEILAGQAGHVNYEAIPSVVYTHPEAAMAGRTEEQLQAAGVAYTVGKFPFTANSRARAMGETEGFVKILADKTTDRVLGVHIIGPQAGELIAEAALALEFSASAEDLARTCHAHPGLGEALKEAALAVAGRAIHS
ncbi:MAG: dihydrolipoyl dehydrogenase [Alphaproteobacteria bacterium RIFOXYD12_FULL_60_8]|nr:MAG: dihydrolipoyl dehydrogenase [Alphaproteobacteria bacterium RIFOXYD12_FULL_60_8]